MDNTFKNTSASLAIALCSPFLEADTDKDGFQRTSVIWCCDADGKSFSNPPSWALPDFDPTPNKQTPAPGNTANQQPPTHTKAPSTQTPPKNINTDPPPISISPPTSPKQPPMSVQNTPPNVPMPSSKPKTYLQTLVDGDGALATIASYKAEEKTTIKANTDALIGLVETSTNNTTEAVSSLVAGTNQFFNQVSSNASISQNLKDTFSGFYHLASNTSHDLVGLQSSLSQLISQVEQLQQALLTSLLNTSIMRTQTEGGLFAVNHRNQLDPQSRQGKGKAIQDLGTLLAYLQATQSKLKAYAKDHPSLLAATPSSIVATQSGHVNGDLYGVNAQLGYKQFFGKKKRFGLRYYGSFSYQYGTLTDKYATALSNLSMGQAWMRSTTSMKAQMGITPRGFLQASCWRVALGF